MNRIATTLTILSASAFLAQTLGAAETTLETLNSKITSLEARLSSVEASLSDSGSSYSYNKEATREATNAGGTSTYASTSVGQTYVIKDGDTLGKIAEKFKVDRKGLLEANRLSEGQPIYIGETLIIPGGEATISQATTPLSAGTGTVADAGKPVEVKQSAIVVGETKKVPAPPVPPTASAVVHTVGKGDTLTSVAKKYNTSVPSLKSANGLRSDTISLGQKLKVPSAQTASNSSTPASTPKNEQSNAFEYDNELLRPNETYGYYTVNKGDNLYALARDFFTTMPELQRVNRLGSSTVIFPGAELIVPTSKYNAYHKTGEVATR